MAENFRIIVTEVTIYGRQRCVAGWDIDRKAMVRPEPAPAAFWEAYMCGVNTTFHPGHIVTFTGERAQTNPPHRREDVVVKGSPRHTRTLTQEQFHRALRQAAVASPQAVFADYLHFEGTKAFVQPGADCGSLCGVEIPRTDLHFHVDTYGQPRLRASFALSGHRLDLSIAAKDLKQAFQKEELSAAEALMAHTKRLHLRLGLARPFAFDGRAPFCYLQINGIYPLA